MTTPARPRKALASKVLGYALPSLALASSLGAIGYLRYFFQPRRLFLPDRYPNGIWDPAPFGLPAEDLWLDTPDGERLHGWWIPHPQARGTILYCHGNSGNIGQQVGFLRHLRRLRVDLLAFDYRGYGRSSGEPSEQGLYLDARAAHDHLTGPLGRRPEEVMLFGQSLGGAIAIDCATDRAVAGLIVQGSFTDVRGAARAAYPSLPIHLAARNQFRSIDKVPHLTIPKLFIHGAADNTIPPIHAERLFAAAAEPKELYLVPGGDHTDLYRQGGVRYLWRLARFRRRCLGPLGGGRHHPPGDALRW